jgi:hypothetical protein
MSGASAVHAGGAAGLRDRGLEIGGSFTTIDVPGAFATAVPVNVECGSPLTFVPAECHYQDSVMEKSASPEPSGGVSCFKSGPVAAFTDPPAWAGFLLAKTLRVSDQLAQ